MANALQGPAQSVNNDLADGKNFKQAPAAVYYAVIMPGASVGADRLRGEEKTVAEAAAALFNAQEAS